jgi:hypothetical protein
MYKVSFGIARCWNEEETKENTRHRFFNDEKKAWNFLDRLNKFTFKDKTLRDFKLIAWNDLEEVNNEIV